MNRAMKSFEVESRFIIPFIVALCLLLFTNSSFAQCGPGTPSFSVDLSGVPDSAWISADTVRNDTCCGAVAPDKCVEILLTLDESAQGIIFDVCDGALPPGALFYQVACGPQTAVGEILCLSGAGPHKITFCKPGNNQNKYCITSIPEPSAGPDLAVNDGCMDTLSSVGFLDTSIVWTSIFPGIIGAYDTLLSCTTDCDTTTVDGGNNFPAFIDYQVCGLPVGGCDTVKVCDTVRVFFFNTLNVEITPRNPTVCFGNATTGIKANPNGGSPPYQFNWSTGEIADSIQVGVGTYIVELSDASGCPPTSDTIIVTEFLSSISADAGNDTSICNQDLPITITGSITAATGGKWSEGNGTYAPSDSSLSITYTPDSLEQVAGFTELILTTTGNGTCPAAKDTITISFNSFTAALSDSITNVSCNGGNDGVASIKTTGGSGPFSYQWDGNTGSQTGSTASNLSIGTYSVTVTDMNGCTDTTSSTIAQPNILNATIINSIDVSCNGGNDGSASASASGGTPPYSYLWPSNNTDSLDTALSAGTYVVTVTDANNCSDTVSVTINQPSILNANIINSTDVSCNGGNDGSASASASGGTPPYTYLWPSNNTDSLDTDLIAGTYIVTVTDANNCSDTVSVTINQPSILNANIINSTDVSCNGGNDGSASASASGGTPPYSYLWPSNNTDSLDTDLIAGTYVVTVTDANNCSDTVSVTINQPSILNANIINSTDVSCNGGNDGSASASASGGTPPYTYLWPSNNTDSLDTDLIAGTYVVTVTDANNCSDTVSVTINQPSILNANIINSTDVSCNGGNDGSASASASGGTLPYTYLWPSNNTDSLDTDLIAGTYVVTVTDANNCSDTVSVTINQPSILNANIINSTDVSCNGGNDGSTSASASGGTPPYTYLWPSNNTDSLDTALSAGTYIVTVTDANNCSDTVSVTINQPSILNANIINSTDVSCNGGNDGSASASASGGTPPYTYLWPSNNTDSLDTDLIAGTYVVTVTDANNCSDTVSVTINQPSILNANIINSTDVSCNGGNDGSASASASGGTPPYSYLWPSNNTDSLDTDIIAGTYIVTVTDANNCSDTASVLIDQPDQMTMEIITRNVSCNNAGDGSIALIPAGGTTPYTYTFSTGHVDSIVSNLAPSTYSMTMTDNNNCSIDSNATIQEPPPLIVSTSSNDTICIGDSITIQANSTGGNGNYSYNWNFPQGEGQSQVVFPNQTTSYNVTVTDRNACMATDNIVVYVRDLGSEVVSVESDGDICLGDSTKIFANHNGNLPPYTYRWNPIGSGLGPFNVSPSEATTYTLTVEDGCGNPIRDSVRVDVKEFPLIDLPSIIKLGCSPLTVSFVDTLNMNPINYSYRWDFGDGNTSFEQNPIHTYEQVGDYTVNLSITSGDGCQSKSNSGGLVSVKPNPIASFIIDPAEITIDSPIVNISNSSFGAISSTWVIKDTTVFNIDDTLVTYSDTGTFPILLSVKNEYGCTDIIRQNVIVKPVFELKIPNAFAPSPLGSNGGTFNRINPTNQVFFVFADFVRNMHMMIFNRWGELVFESKDQNLGWDGYYKGKLSQSDVYVYKVKITWADGSEQTAVGDLTLIR